MALTNQVTTTNPVQPAQQLYWPQDLNVLKLSEEDLRVIEVAIRWARQTQNLLPSDGNEPYVMEKDKSVQDGSKLPCTIEVWSDLSLIQVPDKTLWDEGSSTLMRASGCNAVFYSPDTGQSYFKQTPIPLTGQVLIEEHAKKTSEKISSLIPILYASGDPLVVRDSPSPDAKDSRE